MDPLKHYKIFLLQTWFRTEDRWKERCCLFLVTLLFKFNFQNVNKNLYPHCGTRGVEGVSWNPAMRFRYIAIFWKVFTFNRWPYVVHKMLLISWDSYANFAAETRWRHPTWQTFFRFFFAWPRILYFLVCSALWKEYNICVICLSSKK